MPDKVTKLLVNDSPWMTADLESFSIHADSVVSNTSEGAVLSDLKELNPREASGSDLIVSTIEAVHEIRPQVTFDVKSSSPFVSQANTRKFGRRI